MSQIRPVRIANCSGFYGDRLGAAREMVDGGPIDVLTGDWLAELTMTILARSAMKGGAGYARTFVTQMRDVLADCQAKGIRVVSNAGGLDPHACAQAVREFAPEDVRIAVVTGDNLSERVPALHAAGESFTNLDTGEAYDAVPWPTLTANAYLGSAAIAAALAAGADVVITGRVTDAALVVGPAAWWHGWDLTDAARADAVAGAILAGHVIECGAQATGGNYAFFTEVPGAERPGFPIAEVGSDGTSVITKHPDTGGLVSVGTVTSQLLYEVGSPTYLTPDVTAMFDTPRVELVGSDRVRISGTRGQEPPPRLKVAMTRLGGFRNTMELILTGLDIEAKAELVLAATAGVTLEQVRTLDEADLAAASRWDVAGLDVRLLRRDQPHPTTLAAAQAVLRITAKDPDAAKVGKPVTASLIESGLSSYPGFYASAPPSAGTPFAVLWPTSVAREHAVAELTIDGEAVDVDVTPMPHGPSPPPPAYEPGPAAPDGPTRRIPLGVLVGARSGDKGGTANIGVWIKDPSEPEAVAMASGVAGIWAPLADGAHDTAALWQADAPMLGDPADLERADAAYAWLLRTLTADRLAEVLADVIGDGLIVHRFANVRGINIELPAALGRGVADSTSIDPQAKSLGEYLRSIEFDIPESVLPGGTVWVDQ